MVRQLQEDPKMKRRNTKGISGEQNPGGSNRGRNRGPDFGDSCRNDLDNLVQQRCYGQNLQRNGKPSSTSVASRAYIVPASKSVLLLPREIELAQDEADNDVLSITNVFDLRRFKKGLAATSQKQPYTNPNETYTK